MDGQNRSRLTVSIRLGANGQYFVFNAPPDNSNPDVPNNDNNPRMPNNNRETDKDEDQTIPKK